MKNVVGIAIGLLAVFLSARAVATECGVPVWIREFNLDGADNYAADALVVDQSNNVIIGGSRFVVVKYSPDGLPVWTNRYVGPLGGEAEVTAIAADKTGGIVAVGTSIGSRGDSDYTVVKYTCGGTPLWTNRYDGPADWLDVPASVAVDGAGDIIVSGRSSGLSGRQEYATLKYSKDGIPLWTNRFHGDKDLDDFVFSGTVDSGNNPVVTGVAGGCCVTIKYSQIGVPLWTNFYSTSTNALALGYKVVTDRNNDVVVFGTDSVGATLANWFLIKYTGEGTALWTNLYFGASQGGGAARSVVVDGENDIIVAGVSPDAHDELAYNYMTIKYSGGGNLIWSNLYAGPGNGADGVFGVAVDSHNNAIVTGFSDGGGFIYDCATIKYSTTGVPLWTNRFHNPLGGSSYAFNVAVDGDDAIVIAGTLNGSNGVGDALTLKYVGIPNPILSSRRTDGAAIELRVDDLKQSCTAVIEASTDFHIWSPIYSNFVFTNSLIYTDWPVTNWPARFYRAYQHP